MKTHKVKTFYHLAELFNMNTQHLQLNTMTNLIPPKWTFLFCFTALLCLSPQYTYAQCTIHTRDNGLANLVTNNASLGQTFLPCADGEITSISVTAIQNQITGPAFAGTYELYIAVEPGTTIAIPATPVASLNFPSAPGDLEVLTFTLSTPFPVSSGTLYRFVVDNTSADTRLRFTSNEYAGGALVIGSSVHANLNDLDFEIIIQPSSTSSSAEVPTLSEWGLIILALMLMTAGTLVLVQPKTESQKSTQSL